MCLTQGSANFKEATLFLNGLMLALVLKASLPDKIDAADRQ